MSLLNMLRAKLGQHELKILLFFNFPIFVLGSFVSHDPPVSILFAPSSFRRSKPLQKYRRDRTPEEKVYPKPAYSYACLIALALKNSMTGSLPVSEIYSFMW